jgi:tetratricopeptide (TPR) repeat protein
MARGSEASHGLLFRNLALSCSIIETGRVMEKTNSSKTIPSSHVELRRLLGSDNLTGEDFYSRWQTAARRARLEGNITALRLLIGLLEKSPNPFSPQASALFHEFTGAVELMSGSYSNARYHCERQLACAEELGLPEVISACISLSQVALHEFRLDEVERLLTRADLAARKLGDPETSVRILNRQAQLASYRHLTTSALEKAEQALERARIYKLPLEEAFALNWLGVNYVYNQQIDKAETVLLQAVRLRQEHSDALGRSETLANLSRVYLKQGEYAFARNCMEGSLAILQQLHNRPSLAQGMYYMGVVLNTMGKPETALSWAMRAVELRFELGEPRKIAEALTNLAKIYANLGEDTLALACHTKVLELHEAGDTAPVWIDLLISAGDYLLEMPDDEHRATNWELALDCYKMALHVVEANDELYYLAPTLGRMARALRKINGVGGLEQAARCYRLQLGYLGDMDKTRFDPQDAIAQRAEALSGIQICMSLLRRQPAAQVAD